MKNLRFYYRMRLTFDQPVKEHDFALRFVPYSDSVQRIDIAGKTVEPADWLQEERDAFGNHLYIGRCSRPHDYFMYEVKGTAKVDAGCRVKEPCRECYAYPSKLTAGEPEVKRFLENVCLPDGGAFEKACILMQRLYDVFAYEPGATDIYTTAGEALRGGRGVCQDYAHIFIALCRQCRIPARYVAGLQIGEGATHAWAEIYEDGMWKGFDPTHNRFVDDVYIKLSHGRDYTDCILDRGIFYGQANQEQEIYVNVEEIV
ncbi:MAG: transglutaminase family protein [Eubacteriales bacterium]|nr:transglutaminase family protein [Eubacteriales bacterium]